MILSFASLSFSQLEFKSSEWSAFFWSALLLRNLSFIVFLSSNWIKLGFLCFFSAKFMDWLKNYF